MKPFVRLFVSALALLLILSACSVREELIPDADVPLVEPSAPELATVGMEPEEAAVAFVEA